MHMKYFGNTKGICIKSLFGTFPAETSNKDIFFFSNYKNYMHLIDANSLK